MTKVVAKLRYLHIAPRKVGLLVKLIRGMDARKAEAQLKNSKQRSALPLGKLLKSAVANAKNNFNLTAEDFVIKEICVTQGPMSKRGFPRSRGRVDVKRKRTSHVTLVLEESPQATNQINRLKAKS